MAHLDTILFSKNYKIQKMETQKAIDDLNGLLDLRRQALQELLSQARTARDKPLYKQLKLRLKQIAADASREEIK